MSLSCNMRRDVKKTFLVTKKTIIVNKSKAENLIPVPFPLNDVKRFISKSCPRAKDVISLHMLYV